MKRLLMLGSGSVGSTLSIRLRGLACHLHESWDITMVLPSADKYNNFTPNKQAVVEGARLVQPWQLTTHSPILNLIPYLFTSFARIVTARADVVYLYKPTPITVLGLIPRLFFRTPVILDMDDIGSEVMKLEGQSKFQYGLVALCERLTMRFSSAVVVTSTALREAVLARHPKKKVLIVPNAVEPTDYTPIRAQKPRHGVYFFGGINRLDVVEDLLRATPKVVHAVPDVKITIVGGGVALDDAVKLARELGVEKSVTFPGWQTNMLAVQGFTQFGDIGICYQRDTPTVRAASNMKVFQYMAMSTVPLVSDVGDLHDYVQDGRAGVVVAPGNVDALGSALITLLKDDVRRAQLANKAFELAQTTHSWKARAAQLNEFMEEVRS